MPPLSVSAAPGRLSGSGPRFCLLGLLREVRGKERGQLTELSRDVAGPPLSPRKDHIPILPELPPEARPPRPRRCCRPGAQMRMIGSDGPLTRLGLDAIFEGAAVFESCCSFAQREESEVSSGVQVGGDMSYKCTAQLRRYALALPTPFPSKKRGLHGPPETLHLLSAWRLRPGSGCNVHWLRTRVLEHNLGAGLVDPGSVQ